MCLNKSNNIKKEFLKGFFEKVDGLTYGVIDVDDNLQNNITNDIDIWVKKEDLNSYIKALYEYANLNTWIIRKIESSPRIHGNKEAKYALLLPESPFIVIQLDIWVDFHWRSLPMLNCDFTNCLEQEVYYSKVSNEKALYVQILKDILYKGEIKEKVKNRIAEMDSDFINNYLLFIKDHYSNTLQHELIDSIYNKKYLFNAAKYKKSLIFHSIKNRPFQQLSYLLAYTIRFVYTKFISQNGIHLILLGPDGAGKTTIGDIVYNSEMVNDFYERKSYEHTRFKIIPSLQKIIGFFKKNNNEKKSFIARDINILSKKRAMIYPLYYMIDYVMGFLWLYKMKTSGGSFVMFDRYFDEYYIQKTFKNLSGKYLKIIEFFIPKPTLYILVSNDPELIYNRKQELPLEEIKEQIVSYTKLVESRKNGFIILNDKKPNDAADKVLSIICNTIKEGMK